MWWTAIRSLERWPSWRAWEQSIRSSVRSALAVAQSRGYRSLALPLIGAGTGAVSPEVVERILLETFAAWVFDGEIRPVRYRP